MIRIFVLNVPEFAPLVEDATRQGLSVSATPDGDYSVISSPTGVRFDRRRLGVKPAIWYGLFTGGVDGVIERFDRDSVQIAPCGQPLLTS